MGAHSAVDARVLQRRYRWTLFLSALLLVGSIGAYGWVTVRNEERALRAELLSKAEALQFSLRDTVNVTRSHVFSMRQSVEVRLSNPELAETGLVSRIAKAAAGSPKDAPWEAASERLRLHLGSVHVDPQVRIPPAEFQRDLAAASSILALASGAHEHHKVFQWSYYYDAQQRWWLVYPQQSRSELMAATDTKDVSAALKVLFDAGGTVPLVTVSPVTNPRQEMVWTPPYLDASGKGMMVTLLAPVYLGREYVGAVGADVTLTMLNTVLLQRPKGLGRAFVIDGQGTLLADSDQTQEGLTHTVTLASVVGGSIAGTILGATDSTVSAGDSEWIRLPLPGSDWTIVMQISQQRVNAHLGAVLKPYVALSVALLCSILGLGWIQNRRYARPALLLAEYVDALESDPHRAEPPVPEVWKHWFERVAQSARERLDLLRKTMNHAAQLEEKVKARTEALTTANGELSQALSRLQSAQSQLVRSEKMAGLGAMVAGVSHELNTPLGNALLMASTLAQSSKYMQSQMQAGLRKSDLERFVSEVEQGSDVVERNVRIAAQLVQRFKEVAVNQANEHRGVFNLHDTILGVLTVTGPMVRRVPCTAECDVPPDLSLDSYPGAIAQVLSNLISNACTHAFDGRTDGAIRIVARSNGAGQVTVSVSDNGVGIDHKHLPRVFDPFFTTKMGRGGTGLGLHIVLNVVEEVLGGTIEVQSDANGTLFTLELPMVAPHKEVRADGGADSLGPGSRLPFNRGETDPPGR